MSAEVELGRQVLPVLFCILSRYCSIPEFQKCLAAHMCADFELGKEFARLQPNVLRRYKHLEKLIGFYDDSLSNITKYWTYGCWCFQMGNFPLRMGNGSPVDNVDK